MDTASLKYFIVTAELQHMSRAAEQLNITQPSLSASIKRLENEIGFELFDRNKRGITLNEYGKMYLKGVLEAESAINGALAEMEALRKASASLIRLSCSGSPGNSALIDRLLSDGINLKISDISRRFEQELLSRECDLVITVGLLHHANIASACLTTQELAFVAGPSHPLASSKNLTLEQLNAYPFCSTDAPHSLYNVLRELHPEYKLSPRIAFFGRNSADMLKAIRSGRFIGLMVKRNLPEDQELCILPVENFHAVLPLYLYWRQEDSKDLLLSTVRRNICDFYGQLT